MTDHSDRASVALQKRKDFALTRNAHTTVSGPVSRPLSPISLHPLHFSISEHDFRLQTSHFRGSGTPTSLVNAADDYPGVPIFGREWERRCCAAMLAWYVDVRDDENNFSRHALDDVLRVLGAANASDEESFCAVTSSDGRERFPVAAAARLRREGSLSRRDGSNGEVRGDDEAFAKTVELDARLRWNLMLEA